MLWGMKNEVLFAKEVHQNYQYILSYWGFILAVPLMREGIDDVIPSFPIENGKLWTTLTREIFKILMYFFLQNIIIWDGLSFNNVNP